MPPPVPGSPSSSRAGRGARARRAAGPARRRRGRPGHREEMARGEVGGDHLLKGAFDFDVRGARGLVVTPDGHAQEGARIKGPGEARPGRNRHLAAREEVGAHPRTQRDLGGQQPDRVQVESGRAVGRGSASAEAHPRSSSAVDRFDVVVRQADQCAGGGAAPFQLGEEAGAPVGRRWPAAWPEEAPSPSPPAEGGVRRRSRWPPRERAGERRPRTRRTSRKPPGWTRSHPEARPRSRAGPPPSSRNRWCPGDGRLRVHIRLR